MKGVRQIERVGYGLLVRLVSCVHAISPEGSWRDELVSLWLCPMTT